MRLTLLFLLVPALAAANDVDRGLHAMVMGDYVTAEADLSKAVAQHPNDASARFNYASTLRELGRLDQALVQYQQAFSCGDDKVRSDSLYGIALLRDAQNDPTKSAQAWRQYLDFSGGDRNQAGSLAIARERLAMAEQQVGKRPPGTQKAGR